MVTNISSFGRSGLYDWIVQRLTAVILASYALCILGTLLQHPEMSFQEWQAVFEPFAMRFFTLLALLSLLAHGWIGMWTVATDYLTEMALGNKATVIRFLFQSLCVLFTLFYLVWGIEILWGS